MSGLQETDEHKETYMVTKMMGFPMATLLVTIPEWHS